MKSKVLAALVATMAVGATCAFAANPFVDVPSDSWAYKSVVELADAGIIQGVDGQYFQGNRNITRYEAAEMVAKAMAHMDKASVEQRALINKLADEFADELNNLGVRVSALENRVGNVKLTGDARVRYRYQKDSKENDNSWDYRVRLRANAMVNKNTKVTYGISTGNHAFSDNGKAEDENDILSDIAKVDYNFGGGDWTLSVGRTDKYVIGGSKGYGYNYGDIFDRAELKYSGDSFMATAGYGKFKAGGVAGLAADPLRTVLPEGLDGTKTAYGVIEGRFGNGTAIGGYYNTFDNDEYNAIVRGTELDYLWGAYASFNLGKDWNLLANYERVNYNSNISTSKVRSDEDSATVWIGRLTYGKAVMATPKTWDAWVEYLNAEDGAYIGGSTNSWRWGKLDNLESWGAGIDYTFAKNAQFQVMQSFASKVKDGDGSDPEEQTRAQFVFAF
ncbi:MAG: S-layer homology domain-containing protein [Megasphaera massiliensis]|uniref:S-layer homology domain-containing protein n=1 Tax=Megasphaera massiliensis TaxID=1232428 RepID=UPI002A75D84E|nr:S-layer homology domain-containing protein [Megasphaera massiliensis]MDY2965161.1 S-layer homology domain-containing protein [Megasphaera massiliensis]